MDWTGVLEFMHRGMKSLLGIRIFVTYPQTLNVAQVHSQPVLNSVHQSHGHVLHASSDKDHTKIVFFVGRRKGLDTCLHSGCPHGMNYH